MFTSYMTNEEMEREAYLDFLEMKTSLQIAFETFCRQYKSSGNGVRHCIHTLVTRKTYHTKRNNTWQVHFNNRCHKANNRMVRSFLVFIPILRNNGLAEYIFFRSLTDFKPERVTTHFIQRYKERYLEPNNINLQGLPPAVYFEYSTSDMKKTQYYPDSWTEEDKKNKVIWLSDQGLFVTDKKDEMRVFITFLDVENLSRYKAIIYEEENLMRLVFKACKYEDVDKQRSVLTYIYHHYSKAENIIERYLRRIYYGRPDLEEFVAGFLRGWDYMKNEINTMQSEVEQLREKEIYERIKQDMSMNKDLLQSKL